MITKDSLMARINSMIKDIDIGLKYLNNNKELYLKILNNFLNRYRDLKIELLEDCELEDTIHNIKGLSSTLGMVKLSKLATDFHENKDKSKLPDLSKALSLVINELKMEIESNNIDTILLINDKIVDIDILVELLDENYDIIVALDKMSALNSIDSENISLILLDTAIKSIDIYELYSNLEKTNIPIILIIDNSNKESLDMFLKINISTYVVKPFNIIQLEKCINKHLRFKNI